jgi:hypothetical protein
MRGQKIRNKSVREMTKFKIMSMRVQKNHKYEH